MKKLTVVEEAVMLAIYTLEEHAYSVTIHQKILEMTGNDMIIGTLFNALRQLHRKGFLIKSEKSSKEGRKNIMLYRISGEGLKALEQTREMHRRIWSEIPDVLSGGGEAK